MPKKVVKKKKKAVKKEKPEGEEDDEPKSKLWWPEYQDPEIFTPRAKLKVALAAPIISKLTFSVEMMVTARVEDIR